MVYPDYSSCVEVSLEASDQSKTTNNESTVVEDVPPTKVRFNVSLLSYMVWEFICNYLICTITSGAIDVGRWFGPSRGYARIKIILDLPRNVGTIR